MGLVRLLASGGTGSRFSSWIGRGCCLVVAALPALVSAEPLTGRIKVDGSSTVAPIMIAAAELFQEANPGVQVPVGISGTGGGFKKFLDAKPELRTEISNASRPISQSEQAKAAELGIEYIEIPVAIDGIAIVVHPSNAFCNDLTTAELKKIWEPGSSISNWKDVRAGFPDLPLKLYGPGTDSGTFDYFTEAIVGKEKASRSDYTASESDNALVQGVAGDKGSLGYFGFSYYEANTGKLKLLAVAHGESKAIKPDANVIRSGAYKPLARPLFVYVNRDAYKKPEVRAFLGFLLSNSKKIVEHPKVQYVAFSPEVYKLGEARLAQGKTGSAMAKAAGEHDILEIFKKN